VAINYFPLIISSDLRELYKWPLAFRCGGQQLLHLFRTSYTPLNTSINVRKPAWHVQLMDTGLLKDEHLPVVACTAATVVAEESRRIRRH